ncbi:MAG: serine hydrolase domain-containing protein [Chitinophagaceae bacterium]
MRFFTIISFLLLFFACKKSSTTPLNNTQTDLYFPPITGNTWQTKSASSLGWNESEINNLYTYLQQKNTKAFIILKNGEIVIEKYFGTFTQDSAWYWASAGKTLTAFLVGIAQQEGLLNINQRSSQYLGTGFTSLPLAKENLITIKHQLTMTTGLDDGVAIDDCTLPACLQFKADAGTRWAYHNAPYTLLDKVIENATGKSYNAFFQEKIASQIGMKGVWLPNGTFNNIMYSNARSMARFGLLLLNKGTWSSSTILRDSDFFDSQINSSQTINPSYGYLTWLNGKSSYILPSTQFVFTGMLTPNAPADMYAALGKNDQKIYVVPSQKIVVIRMGESAGNSQLALSSFDNELWGKLKLVMKF